MLSAVSALVVAGVMATSGGMTGQEQHAGVALGCKSLDALKRYSKYLEQNDYDALRLARQHDVLRGECIRIHRGQMVQATGGSQLVPRIRLLNDSRQWWLSVIEVMAPDELREMEKSLQDLERGSAAPVR
ncbi:MAG TPA: hypothetical protein VG900_13240 [Hyphomicrobiaceae bacterium]|jgi:hypothetical protein|nr:hypothetical protein [Hyphomicrobiaceae bacterium]